MTEVPDATPSPDDGDGPSPEESRAAHHISRRTFLGLAAVGTVAAVGAVELLSRRGPAPRATGPATSPRGSSTDGAVGYTSVGAMLEAAPFAVAHRGCSRSWPEMSLYAYSQAARAGFGALELSLARTSDGVWFGLHDDTLDRTSGVTGKTASAMTWAEVQQYKILGSTAVDDSSQADQPYMRWEEIIETFYRSHVILVDPKTAADHSAELMKRMNALSGTPQDHLVCKGYGVSGDAANTTGWAKKAADNGYHRWGYFYAADVAHLADYQGRWDLLGMEYSAPADVWATTRAFGKPIIGHIVENRADFAAARAEGAVGVVASDAAVLPLG